ncbi:MAG: c-type cytochrome [Polymorphobacter sp.]|uniref:c-type cytochrome n=1 Tax=Polymorphobacter sp. TaxID=1909290 RepID=UPI003A8ADF1F
MRNFVAAGLGVAALTAAAVPAQEYSRNVWDGVYTKAQATAGAEIYAQRCGQCHGVQLGGTGEAPGLVGGEFLSNYDTQSVGDLYDRMRTTMPMDNPQSLSREDYASVLAFVLQFNGFPAGDKPLDRRSAWLGMIAFQAQKPADKTGD